MGVNPGTRTPTFDDTERRARNGGTSAPAGASVWDIQPAEYRPDGPHVSVATVPEVADVSPVPSADIESDRAVAPVTEPLAEDAASVPSTTRSAVARRLLVLLAVAVLLAAGAWILARDDAAGDSASDDTDRAVPVQAVPEPTVPEPTVLEQAVPEQLASDGPVNAPVRADPAPPPPPAGSSRDGDAPIGDVASGPEVIESAGLAETPEPAPAGSESATTSPDEGSVRPEAAIVVVDAVTGVDSDGAPEAEIQPIVEDAAAAPSVDGRRVDIATEIEPCRFGSACLVAGFEIAGFDAVPDRFVCEFGNGDRFEFDLPGSSVGFACATGSRGSSITIEVDGVRSETVVFD